MPTSHVEKQILRWWPSAVTLGAVLWLTLAPEPLGEIEPPGFLGPYADKVVHFIMFGGLTGAIVFDIVRAGMRLDLLRKAVLVVAMTAFAAADEWAQGAMHIGRTADILDLAADTAGILTAIVIAPPLCRHLLHRHRR